jgi:hypothetical protein
MVNSSDLSRAGEFVSMFGFAISSGTIDLRIWQSNWVSVSSQSIMRRSSDNNAHSLPPGRGVTPWNEPFEAAWLSPSS